MAVLTDPRFKQVLFNLGEGLDETDLMASQAYSDAKIFDQLVYPMARAAAVTDEGLDPDLEVYAEDVTKDIVCWAVGGGAFPFPSATNLKTVIAAGTIFQSVASPNGTTPRGMIPFYFDGSTELTHSAGHATLDRIDLIQCKLEYVNDTVDVARHFEDATTRAKTSQNQKKKRFVQCTISIVEGTPAASDPEYPAPASGYCALGAVYVPATYATTFLLNHMRCLQIPLGIRVIDVPAWMVDRGGHADGWEVNAASGASHLTSIDNPCEPGLVWPMFGGQSARLLAVGFTGLLMGSGDVAVLKKILYPGTITVPTRTVVLDLSPTLGDAGPDPAYKHASLVELSAGGGAHHLPGTPNTTYPTIGDPIWLNGRAYGPAERNVGLGSAFQERLALELAADAGSTIYSVRFIIATGL